MTAPPVLDVLFVKQDDPRFWAQIREWQRLGIIRPRGYNLASPHGHRPDRDRAATA